MNGHTGSSSPVEASGDKTMIFDQLKRTELGNLLVSSLAEESTSETDERESEREATVFDLTNDVTKLHCKTHGKYLMSKMDAAWRESIKFCPSQMIDENQIKLLDCFRDSIKMAMCNVLQFAEELPGRKDYQIAEKKNASMAEFGMKLMLLRFMPLIREGEIMEPTLRYRIPIESLQQFGIFGTFFEKALLPLHNVIEQIEGAKLSDKVLAVMCAIVVASIDENKRLTRLYLKSLHRTFLQSNGGCSMTALKNCHLFIMQIHPMLSTLAQNHQEVIQKMRSVEPKSYENLVPDDARHLHKECFM